MDELIAIDAGISTLEKLVPVIDAVGQEIGPLVQSELKDGKVLWSALDQCWQDFKIAAGNVKAAAAQKS